MRIQVKRIWHKTQGPDFTEIAKSVEKAMRGPIAARLREYAEKVVADWDTPPDWVVIWDVTKSEASVFIMPFGPGRDRWIWTSRGTEPHVIRPKQDGGMLAFRTDYAPHTKPSGPSYGGPGIATGPWVRAKEVHHPGTKARHFEEAWARWSKTWYSRMIDEAIEEGIDRAWAKRQNT